MPSHSCELRPHARQRPDRGGNGADPGGEAKHLAHQPRMKASSADTASTASTTRSTQVIEPPRRRTRRGYRPQCARRQATIMSDRAEFGAKPGNQVGDVADFRQLEPLGRASGRLPRATRRGRVACRKPSLAASFSRARPARPGGSRPTGRPRRNTPCRRWSAGRTRPRPAPPTRRGPRPARSPAGRRRC